MLIEATCNQVNQDGGYTGMTPADFRAFVEGIADRVGFARERLILGGDHLGPNPWRSLPAAEALDRARRHGRRLRARRLRQDPSRHQHGLRKASPPRCPTR